MEQAPSSSQAIALTAEQQIALALISEVQGRLGIFEHRFNDGKNAYVVQIMCEPIDEHMNEPKGMYHSLGPAGESCKCCNGSGKRAAQTGGTEGGAVF